MDKSDIRKYNDNKNKKMKYWKKIYPFINVKEEQYEEFSKNFMKINLLINLYFCSTSSNFILHIFIIVFI
mgnify:CR=1 FL=1